MWHPANEHPGKDTHQVLVLFRKPFFGIYVLEPEVGLYDDPEGYLDGRGGGWMRWFDERPLDVVYWTEIPEHEDLPYDKQQRPEDAKTRYL
jgi:hypothetical protein